MPSVSGKYFKGRINGVVISGLTDADIDESGDELDATDAESDGVSDTDVGVIGARIRLRGIHKIGSGPWNIGLRAGTIITNLRIYNSGTTGPYWSFPIAVIPKNGQQVRVRGRIEWSAEAVNKGYYTYVGN